MMAAVVTRKVPALEELPKASAALGQKAQLHSLQLVSDALGSSGRRLGQITFFSAGSTDKERALRRRNVAGIVRQVTSGT